MAPNTIASDQSLADERRSALPEPTFRCELCDRVMLVDGLLADLTGRARPVGFTPDSTVCRPCVGLLDQWGMWRNVAKNWQRATAPGSDFKCIMRRVWTR